MKYLSVLFIIALLFSGCGEKMKQMKDAAEFAQKAPEMAKNIEQSQDAAKKAREERVKKGDTLAMPYQKLQEYMPASISGYTAEEPAGESVNMQGVSYSMASRRYVQGSGDNESEIEISIMDYNAVESMYAAAAFWVAGYSREDSKSFDRTFDPGIKNVYGLEHYDKVNKRVEVTFAVGYRFLVSIKATNQPNTDLVKRVAGSMKLKDLAVI